MNLAATRERGIDGGGAGRAGGVLLRGTAEAAQGFFEPNTRDGDDPRAIREGWMELFKSFA